MTDGIDELAVAGAVGLLTAFFYAAMLRPRSRPVFVLGYAVCHALWYGSIREKVDSWLSFDMSGMAITIAYIVGMTAVLLRLSGADRKRAAVVSVVVEAAVWYCYPFAENMLEFQLGDVWGGWTNAGIVSPILLAANALIPLLLFLLLVLLAWKLFAERRPASAGIIFSILLVSQLIELVLIVIVGDLSDHTYTAAFVGIALVLFAAADYGIWIVIKKIRQNYEIRRNQEMAESQYKLQEERNERLRHNSRQLEAVRLDMKRQVRELRELIGRQNEEAKNEAVEAYIRQQAARHITLPYCDNSVIDAVLIRKAEQAEAIGADMDISVVLPESTPFEQLDLCSLFVNLLDNAMEACTAMAHPGSAGEGDAPGRNGERAWIHISCYERGGYLIIHCRNSSGCPVVRNRRGAIVSSKLAADGDGGLGLKIIRDIAAKYDGKSKIEHGTGYFRHTVFLSLSSVGAVGRAGSGA